MPDNRSGFAEAVGGILSGYSTVKQFQAQSAEERRRQKEADDAAQLRRIQLDEAGYTLIDGSVPPPKRDGFLAKVGAFLGGGTDTEPTLVPIKDHESVAERNARLSFENAKTLEGQRETFETGLHSADNAARLSEIGLTQSGEDRRAAESSATQTRVANIYAGSAQLGRALELRNQNLAEKQQAVDDAIAGASVGSANGSVDAQRAYNSLPLAVRQRFNIGAVDMNAGLARFRDRKAALERERQQTQLSVAKTKHASWVDGPSPVSGDAPSTTNADPTRTLSDADLWEAYRSQGLSAAEATARVKARSGSSSSSGIAEQRRAYDVAARAALAKGKDPVTVLGRRP